ncbi:hypothetical protein ASG01_13680 [Chryseobacterium sp. Leaf180]|uniref:MauE/DoxX family redox-associated membrane protein n=1 Tax=Chryseobacterium sp. Leaf180 TaxID=1736289 RepID=UPI0006F368B5|nr:MauE/DoxX family redox-associated membrane protein [Chryseobacterium sp. Leaf180]KQR91420.1 hypothetical protein ASG01_13680 [Chryseobacterium sp. Leaf180]
MKTLYKRFPETTAYFFILLFCYASISKIMDFENFQIQIAQSPILSSFAGFVSYLVLGIELMTAVLLLFENTRKLGLYFSFTLMVLFSFYIYLILNYSEFIPCSCGGILEKMDWRTHLVFNLATVSLAAAGIMLSERLQFRPLKFSAVYLIILSGFSCMAMVLLYNRSEHLMRKDNNFTRRFLQHPVTEAGRFQLDYNSYYFGGINGSTIYLGNHTAPFTVSTLSTDFTGFSTSSVNLDQSGFTFKGARIFVKDSKTYLFDGTVPVLYQSATTDLNLKTLSYRQVYFSQLKVLDSSAFAIVTYLGKEKIQALGILYPNHPNPVEIHPSTLEKFKDGIFDTDGNLLVDSGTGEIVYVYKYRNQFRVFNKNLTSRKDFHTIDNIDKPQIDILERSDGQKKMKTPPLTVNRSSFVHRGLLFIESARIGRLEDRQQWNRSLVIDIYSTQEQKYIGSLYLPKAKNTKKTEFFITDDSLYLLIENELLRYRFAQNVTQHFRTGEAENLNKE